MYAYVGNDLVVRLVGAQAVNLSTGVATYLTGAATVQFRIQTAAYVDVAGETWPQAMSYIAGSEGNFLGVVRNDVALQAGVAYRFIATVDAGPDQHGTWDIPLPVLTRH